MVKSEVLAVAPNFRYNNEDEESLYIVAPILMELEGSKIVLETAAATLDVTLVAGLTGETVKELLGEIATTKARSAGVAAVLDGVTATGP